MRVPTCIPFAALGLWAAAASPAASQRPRPAPPGPVAPGGEVLVDIDGGRRQSAVVTLFDRAGRERRYSVPAGWTEDRLADGPPGHRTLDLTTLLPQPGFAAWATTTQSPDFDPRAVVRLVVELGGSGAVDNLRWLAHPDQ